MMWYVQYFTRWNMPCLLQTFSSFHPHLWLVLTLVKRASIPRVNQSQLLRYLKYIYFITSPSKLFFLYLSRVYSTQTSLKTQNNSEVIWCSSILGVEMEFWAILSHTSSDSCSRVLAHCTKIVTLMRIKVSAWRNRCPIGQALWHKKVSN